MPESHTSLRVGLVTTWGTSCGIATYSEELAEELRPRVNQLVVLAEAGPGTMLRREPVPGALRVAPAWSRYQPQGNAAAIAAVVERDQLNVLHVQHEYGLWPNDTALAETLRTARAHGARTVVTLHTVFPSGGYLHTGTLQMLAKRADLVVVHSLQAQAAVFAAGVERVVCMPHGTALRTRGDRVAGLTYFGVPASLIEQEDIAWGLVFGFQASGKNVVGTLRNFALAKASRQLRAPCGLLIAGEIKDDTYAARLNGAAMEGGYLTVLFKRDGFVDAQRRDDVFAAASFGVLNHLGHSPAVLSASGQVHVAASYGLPLACADAPIYRAAFTGGFGVPFQVDPKEPEVPTLSGANAIVALAGDLRLRGLLMERAHEFARGTAWARIADHLVRLYEGSSHA